MRLKKRQFKRLKEISRRINECIPGASDDLNILIRDIESIQKPKTIKEEPLVGAYIESLKEEARDMFFKEGKNAVENSLSDRRSTKGIRNKLRNLDPSIGRKINGVMDVETGSDLEKFLAPQIGDIGYFWDDTDMYKVIRYGVLKAIKKDDIEPYKVNDVYYENFSKTPPELK